MTVIVVGYAYAEWLLYRTTAVGVKAGKGISDDVFRVRTVQFLSEQREEHREVEWTYTRARGNVVNLGGRSQERAELRMCDFIQRYTTLITTTPATRGQGATGSPFVGGTWICV